MPYQIDQSGKMEAKYRTALALSNDHDYTIIVPAKEKHKAYAVLRERYGSSVDPARITVRVFAAAVFQLLVLAKIPAGEIVTIDEEYTGHEADIKNMLLQWLWQQDKDFHADRIQFGRIGDAPPAHRKAADVYRRKVKPNRMLKADDLISPIIGLRRQK